MRKRKGDQPNPPATSTADRGADKGTNEPGRGDAPSETAKIDSPALVPAQTGQAAGYADTPNDAPKLSAPSAEPQSAEPTDAAPTVVSMVDHPLGAARRAGAASAATPSRSLRARAIPLAASIALAAALGAMAGALTTTGLAALTGGEPGPRAASADDLRALKESIVRINTDMVALKAAIDTSGRSANGHFAKFGERLERVERAQAEPAAKLAKITDAIERLERRAPAATTTAASDTTASVASVTPPAAEPARPAGPPVVDGWVLRSVYNGAALIQGRFGTVEVEPGDHLPGLGRIENIRRQDGRWVVVTSKGLIVTR